MPFTEAQAQLVNIQNGYTQVDTNNDLFRKDTKERDRSNLKKLFEIGGSAAATATIFNYASRRVEIENGSYFAFLDSASQVRGNKSEFRDFKTNGTFSLGDLFHETIRKFEEYSPAKVGRTFQFSPLLAPYLSSQNSRFYLSPSDIKANQSYYTNLLKNEGRELDSIALSQGFIFENNKLFLANTNKTANKEKVYLNEARLNFPYFKVPNIGKDKEGKEIIKDGLFINKVFSNYARLQGAEWDVTKGTASGILPVAIIGARSKGKLYADYTRAFGRATIQKGSEAWDKPIEAFEHMIGDTPIFGKLASIAKANLGTSGDYTLGMRASFMKIAKNAATKTILGTTAYYLADKTVRSFSPDTSYFHNGIIAGLTAGAGSLHIRYAKTVSDHFQGLREKQEDIAPGSTRISTLIGLPGSFAIAGAMGAYGKFLYDVNTIGHAQALLSHHSSREIFNVRGKNLLGALTPKITGGRLKSWMLRGAAIGLAIESPFIPGAILGGRSSQELDDEYSGRKEVAVYSNRFWGGGGSPWNGGKIKYFRPSAIYLAKNDYSTKATYGDYETREKLNPFLHPFDYLRDPYRLEKITDDDRPYPVWGMDVSVASFVGKLYEKTFGALIKPDKLNPKFEQYFKDQGDGSYQYKATVSEGDASLIAEGKLLAPGSARKDDNIDSARWSWGAFKEFIGIKGFALSQIEDKTGMDLNGLDGLQLERSGELTNSARELSEYQLGGIGPIGEFQRRFLPTTSGMIENKANPMKNQMPSWLPSNKEDYFIDFSTGDPYRKIDLGAVRLPGKTYSELHPEVKGLNPEDYPDIYKYKILADVALGSQEYYSLKKKEDFKYSKGLMDDAEQRVYGEIKYQEQERAKTKDFYEYKTQDELDRLGSVGKIAAKYWEVLAHDVSDLPYEKLSPIRPTAKFIHQRSAVEDYEATQINTGDAAMWGKPIEHYISPFVTELSRGAGSEYVPQKTQNRRVIDEYFDNLEYLKYRNLYKKAQADGNKKTANEYQKQAAKTVQGSLASGLENQKDVLYSFIALPKRERDYFGSFVNAQAQDRDKIKSLVPDRIGAVYEELWRRKDILSKYYDPSTGTIDQDRAQQEIGQQIQQENQELAKQNPDAYNTYSKSNSLKQQGTFRQYLADQDAAAYINQTTGIPNEEFIGWDPRIDLKDVKLRTLSIGGEDLYEYGYYKNDVQNLRRMIAVLDDQQVTSKIQEIKDQKKSKKNMEEDVRQALIQKGLDPTSVQINQTTGKSKTTVNVTTGS